LRASASPGEASRPLAAANCFPMFLFIGAAMKKKKTTSVARR